MRSIRLIIVGFFLALLGVVLPFLMVVKVVEASFLLSFLSYGASVAGLLMGITGAATYVRERKDKDRFR